MNLSMFIKQIDDIAEKMTLQQMKMFLHESGRILPESQRMAFISKLESFAEGKKKGFDLNCDDQEIQAEFKEINHIIEKIESGEFVLNEILNEEYDEWYHNDEDEFYYEDPDKVLNWIEKICSFIHKCLDREKYDLGAKIGQELMTLKVQTIGDYGDDELYLSDLVLRDLVSVDIRHTVMDVVYCAYQSYPVKKRSEIIFNILSNSKVRNIKLENIFQHGSYELNDTDEFLDDLIEYLGDEIGSLAEVLIKEALSLKNDLLGSIDYAVTYAGSHPSILLDILTEGQGQSKQEFLDLGLKALDLINSKYLIRNEIALIAAEHALSLGQSMIAESCYMEAFKSRCHGTDYLRALLNSIDKVKTRQALRDIYKGISVDDHSFLPNYSRRSELDVYQLNREMLSMLEFLDGNFDKVLDHGMNLEKALGWSGTFMKPGFALFTLLLYQDKQFDSGVKMMLESVRAFMDFSKQEYEMGILNKSFKTDSDLLLECIFGWKETISLDAKDAEKIISRLEMMIEKRVAGIMENNRRNYYGECAAFIAALGEVKASRGQGLEKQNYMEYFRRQYPRRTAFKGELKKYGYKC